VSDTPIDDEGPKAQDIRARIKQITQPLVESLDARLSAQVDKRVDQRVDETFKDRLSVIERAIADLDRAVHELQHRLAGPDESSSAD
jgi:hypothetical protein